MVIKRGMTGEDSDIFRNLLGAGMFGLVNSHPTGECVSVLIGHGIEATRRSFCASLCSQCYFSFTSAAGSFLRDSGRLELSH